MVEKGIRGSIFYSIYRYAKYNNIYMKDYDKGKESSNLQYWEVNIIGQFNEDIKKSLMKKVMKGIFSMFMFNILKNYMTFTMTCNFNLKE